MKFFDLERKVLIPVPLWIFVEQCEQVNVLLTLKVKSTLRRIRRHSWVSIWAFSACNCVSSTEFKSSYLKVDLWFLLLQLGKILIVMFPYLVCTVMLLYNDASLPNCVLLLRIILTRDKEICLSSMYIFSYMKALQWFEVKPMADLQIIGYMSVN